MDAIDFGPWWETGAIDSETLSMKSRDIYPKLKESLEERTEKHTLYTLLSR